MGLCVGLCPHTTKVLKEVFLYPYDKGFKGSIPLFLYKEILILNL